MFKTIKKLFFKKYAKVFVKCYNMEICLTLGFEQGKYKISLEHLVVSERKEVLGGKMGQVKQKKGVMLDY